MINYIKNYSPLTWCLSDGTKEIWDSTYLEVARKCFHDPNLKKDENTILVYSAILSISDNPRDAKERGELSPVSDDPMMKAMAVYFYRISMVATLLKISVDEVEQSIEKLEELGFINIFAHGYESIGIKVNIDLRYDGENRKDVFRVYYRIFFYPTITKQMAMLYSYYWHLRETLSFRDYVAVSYKKVSKALGYTPKKIVKLLKDMVDIGLVSIIERPNCRYMLQEVDFSQKQPEEILFEEKLTWYIEQVRLEREEEDCAYAALQNDLKNFEIYEQGGFSDIGDPYDIDDYDVDYEIPRRDWTSENAKRSQAQA